MFKLTKQLLIILMISVVMFSMVTTTAYAVTMPIEKKDTCIGKIESKEKVVKYKITWNANGGKIGTKKTVLTSVKKGSKINKLEAPPKRSGYVFKGWHSKKTGGTKISKNTKPTKNIVYFAQWKKVSTSTNSKLAGYWQYQGGGPFKESIYSYDYFLYKDGTFNYFYRERYFQSHTTGKYKVSNGKIYFTNILYQNHTRYNDTVFEYKLNKDSVGEYLFIGSFRYDRPYVDISWGVKFRKQY